MIDPFYTSTSLNPHMPKLFVYGTLMHGQKNYYVMCSAEFLTKAKIPGFELYNFPEKGYPGVYVSTTPTPTAPVCGEIYEVSNALIEALDRFEEEYERSTVVYEDEEINIYICKLDRKMGVFVASGKYAEVTAERQTV